MSAPRLGLIWAEARGRVIGRDGGMPWHVPEDLAHFKTLTAGAPVIMGRRTWESLPDRFRPLPGRRNIVVTGSAGWAERGAERAGSLDEALALVGDAERIWVTGGARLFAEAIVRAEVLEVTELDLTVAGDTYAPPLPDWTAVSDPDRGWHTSRTGTRYRFVTLNRPRP